MSDTTEDGPRGHHLRRIAQAERERDVALARAAKAEAEVAHLCKMQTILIRSFEQDSARLTPEARLLLEYVTTRSAIEVVEESQKMLDGVS